jgi:small-conductance mechanosensitive channel
MFCIPKKVAPETPQGDELQQRYRALQFRYDNLYYAHEALKARFTISEMNAEVHSNSMLFTTNALRKNVKDLENALDTEAQEVHRMKAELQEADAKIDALTRRVQNVKDEMNVAYEMAVKQSADLLHATMESLNDANARAMAGANAEIRSLKAYKRKFIFLKVVYRLNKMVYPFVDFIQCYSCFDSKNHWRFSAKQCGHVICTSCATEWHGGGHCNCPVCDLPGDFNPLRFEPTI